MASETASAENLPVQVGFAWSDNKAATPVRDSGNRRGASRVWKAGTNYAKERSKVVAAGTASLDKRTPDKRTSPRRADAPRPPHPSPDVLALVARADVSPEVRDALASFGQALAAGHVARKRPAAARRPWWDRD